MTIFLRLIALILVIIFIVLGIGYLLPRNYTLEASIDIKAPPESVFPYINELQNWQLWSNFSEERIDGLKIQYGAITAGENASQKWEDVRGSGKLWITKSTANKMIQYDMNFAEFPTMNSTIELDKNGEQTTVVWQSNGSLPPGPFYGFFAMLFPGQMNYEYQQSLLRLKETVEK